ncbi:Flp pilus assembly complex ATPase component TadA, partial [archaeon]|nr:Flp pilus assembly complex ATPase component TadA [archaeon]
PDRIIIGEVRTGDEAKAMINSMLAGQGKGCLATFHARSAGEALARLASLGINKIDLGAIDVVVTQRRWTRLNPLEDVRRVTEICGIKGDYDPALLPEYMGLFVMDHSVDSLKQTGVLDAPIVEKIKQCTGMSETRLRSELEARKKLLSHAPKEFLKFAGYADELAHGDV